jgi:hypothetical protein
MATARAFRASVSERALKLVGRRPKEHKRLVYRAAELQIPIPVVSEIRNVPAAVGITEEWEALGAEALCVLHLSPEEVAAAVDMDLGLSADWLRDALGKAMDGR